VEIALLLPCRNESGNLKKLVQGIVTGCDNLNISGRIILCEGNSTDNTWEVCLDIANNFTNRVLIVKQPGKGKFDAIMSGARLYPADYYVVWDSDNTIDLDSGFNLLKKAILRPNDVFVGNRFHEKLDVLAMPKTRQFGNHLLSFMWKFTFTKSVPDLLCGLKGFPLRLVNLVDSVHIKNDFYGDLTFLELAHKHGFRVHSLAVKYSPRSYGSTNITFLKGGSRILRSFFTALIHFWLYRK